MPEYIFAAMIFFSVKSKLWKWLYVVWVRQLRMPAFDWTSWRRVVVAASSWQMPATLSRRPAGRQCDENCVVAKSEQREEQRRRSERQDSWLYFGSLLKPVPTSQASAPYLRNRKKKKLPWVPIKIGYFKRRALPGAGRGLSSVDPMNARRV